METYIPKKLICPITGKLFVDPVLACDGHIYEREIIENILSFETKHFSCPDFIKEIIIDSLFYK